MINVDTKKPIKMWPGGTEGGVISLPYSQVNDLRRALDAHGIRYSVDDVTLSINGGPKTACIVISCRESKQAVQAIVDEAS